MKSLFIFIFLLIPIHSSVYAKEKLSVEKALIIAIKNSFDIKDLDLDKKVTELNYDSGVAELFLPRVSINAEQIQQKNIYELDQNPSTATADDFKYNKQSSVALQIDNINIFNSGRDYIARKILKISRDRELDNLQQSRRQFLYSVYREYFNLKVTMERLETANTAIALTKSFVELAKNLKADKREDIYAAQSELSQAIQQEILIKRDYKLQLFAFNLILNRRLDKEYLLTSDFPKIKASLKGVNLKKTVLSSLEYRNNEVDLKIAKENRVLTNRDIQPYFNLDISGASYGSEWDNDGVHSRVLSSSLGSNFIDASASIGINIPLWGSEGFLASNSRMLANIDIMRIKNNKRRLMKSQKLRLIGASANLEYIQKDLNELNKLIENQAKTLEVIMKRYQNETANAVELRNAISSYTSSVLDSFASRLTQIDAVIDVANSFNISNKMTQTVDKIMARNPAPSL